MIHRVRTRAEFDLIGRRGHRVRDDLLWCTHLHDPSILPPRVAFAIGRAHGPAVVRNRLRRRLRAAFRELAAAGLVPAGTYLVGIERSMTEHLLRTSGSDLIDRVALLIDRASTGRT
ncbi:MAG: ribonuclease P protein component [Ilumatobacteraceae bacterium]